MKLLLLFVLLSLGGYYIYDLKSEEYKPQSNPLRFPMQSVAVLNFAAKQKDGLCYEKSGMKENSRAYESCMAWAEKFTQMCKDKILSEMPEQVDIDGFRTFSLRMMNCIVPVS